jgi:hypothetical protein
LLDLQYHGSIPTYYLVTAGMQMALARLPA